MARKCVITGKQASAARNVSHAHNKTTRWQKPNIQLKRIYDPELGRTVRVRLSVAALRSVSRVGLSAYLRKRGIALRDVLA